jgi:stress-induced morphogen
MAQIAHIPRYVSDLRQELERQFRAETDVQKERSSAGSRYTVAVLSPRFDRMTWSERHDRVWGVAKRMLNEEQLFRVTILPLRPKDVNGQ